MKGLLTGVVVVSVLTHVRMCLSIGMYARTVRKDFNNLRWVFSYQHCFTDFNLSVSLHHWG